MPEHRTCNDCKNRMPSSADKCPHCGRPSYFPNVLDAEATDEIAALKLRYDHALEIADKRGAKRSVFAFESALQDSFAVLSRPAGELLRLSTSDDELYASHYQLLEAGVKSHSRSRISVLRAIIDEALFPGY